MNARFILFHSLDGAFDKDRCATYMEKLCSVVRDPASSKASLWTDFSPLGRSLESRNFPFLQSGQAILCRGEPTPKAKEWAPTPQLINIVSI